MTNDASALALEAKKLELLRLGRSVEAAGEQLRMMAVEVHRLIRRAEQTQRVLTESIGASTELDTPSRHRGTEHGDAAR